MIVNHLRYKKNTIDLKGPDGVLTLDYEAWQKLLQKRGAVSFPFRIDILSTNVTDIFNRHRHVLIKNVEAVR